MKKVIIGATGFIGSAIVRDLLCQGHDVRGSAARQHVFLRWVVAMGCMSLLATIAQAGEPVNPDVRFGSGWIADMPAELLKGGNPVLDLGDVRDLVAVNVNGRHLRTLWKPPYRVALGDALKPGKNELELTVANTWINRFIGDFRRHGRSGVNPENASRYTQEGASTQDYNENTPILESGLLGPVRIYAKE